MHPQLPDECEAPRELLVLVIEAVGDALSGLLMVEATGCHCMVTAS